MPTLPEPRCPECGSATTGTWVECAYFELRRDGDLDAAVRYSRRTGETMTLDAGGGFLPPSLRGPQRTGSRCHDCGATW